MKTKLLFQLIFLLSLLLLSKSLDNHTLSNYETITVTNLEGTFQPDFDSKIVSGNLTYTFQAKEDGNQIVLDSFYLEIESIFKVIEPEPKQLGFSFGETDEKLGTPLNIECEFKQNELI